VCLLSPVNLLTGRGLTIPDGPPEFIGRSPSTNSSWSILRTVTNRSLEYKFILEPHPVQVRFKTVDRCCPNCWIFQNVPPVYYSFWEEVRTKTCILLLFFQFPIMSTSSVAIIHFKEGFQFHQWRTMNLFVYTSNPLSSQLLLVFC